MFGTGEQRRNKKCMVVQLLYHGFGCSVGAGLTGICDFFLNLPARARKGLWNRKDLCKKKPPFIKQKPLKATAVNGFHYLSVPQTGIEPVLALRQTGF